MRLVRSLVLASVLALVTSLVGYATASTLPGEPASLGTVFRRDGAWSASPQRAGVNFTPNWSEQGFADQTVRQTARVSVGGAAVRIRLTNVYGTAPLTVAGATVARTAGAAVRPGSVRRLTVGGASAFTIPAGAEPASDPVHQPPITPKPWR